jgi:hypothetical protein
VDESVVSEYKPKLLNLISPCEPEHITMQTKQDFFRALSTESITVKEEKCTWGVKCPKKHSVIMWEYGGRNGKASCDCKSSKTKMFQEPEN